MENLENAILEKALRFLYERRLAQLGIQADIIITKKERPTKMERRAAA